MSEAELDSAWRAYESSERDRIRSVLLESLRDFIRVFEASADGPRTAWAMNIARRSADGDLLTPIRMPLFREVLYPVLHDGVRDRESGCARWLATFAQHLYHSTDCPERLPANQRSEAGLLREALDVDPDDTRARARLIDLMEYELEYSLHELPHTVLYTQDAATIEPNSRRSAHP